MLKSYQHVIVAGPIRLAYQAGKTSLAMIGFLIIVRYRGVGKEQWRHVSLSECPLALEGMKKLSSVVVFTFCALALVAAQTGQSPSRGESSYPNELPTLKLYEEAKWNSLKAYVSTIDDVEKLLGEPVRLLDGGLHGDFGFEHDPDWTIVIEVVGKGGELPDSVVGRVSHITLYPRKRISLVGADFSAFRRYTYTKGNEEGKVYYDKFGLRYVVYAKDSGDGRFHAGDLARMIYGPSDKDTENYTNKGKSKPN